MSQSIAGNRPAFSPAIPTVTSIPKQKVLAAAGVSGLATPLAVILLYALQNAGFSPPEQVKEAITALVVAILTFLAGYICPPGPAETTVRDSSGAVKSAIGPRV